MTTMMTIEAEGEALTPMTTAAPEVEAGWLAASCDKEQDGRRRSPETKGQEH